MTTSDTTAGKGKGRRLGAAPAMSTTAGATEPEAPPRPGRRHAAPQDDLSTASQTPAPSAEPAAAGTGLAVVRTAAEPLPAAPPEVEVRMPTAASASWGTARRPRAADLITPRVELRKEQISVMVPADLELVRRMTLYKLDHKLTQADQVALALDAWLTAEGY
jgi:hypothetical protein